MARSTLTGAVPVQVVLWPDDLVMKVYYRLNKANGKATHLKMASEKKLKPKYRPDEQKSHIAKAR